jgi:hypothetical protein
VFALLTRGSRSNPTVSSLFAKRKSVFRSSILHPTARDPVARGSRSNPTVSSLFAKRESVFRSSILHPSARDPVCG